MAEQNSFKFTPDRIKALIPFLVLSFIFLISWTNQDIDIRDPWYKAIQKVEDSRKIKDPEEQKKMLLEGGQELREILEKYPKHARVHYFMAIYYTRVNELDSAKMESIKTIEMGKGALVNQVDGLGKQLLSKISMNQANFLIKQKKFQQAIDVMQLSLNYYPNDKNINNHIAYTYQLKNNPDSAIAYYTKAIQIDPKFKIARNNLANILFQYGTFYAKQKKYKLAEENYRKAQSLNPKDASYNNNLANILLQNGKTEESIAFFKKAIELKPNENTFKQNLKIAEQRLANGK